MAIRNWAVWARYKVCSVSPSFQEIELHEGLPTALQVQVVHLQELESALLAAIDPPEKPIQHVSSQ